ncbi:MAG: M23 family metallopeptidase [Bradymonadaceae bacterium]|nr:M23 family metallopeptidase [Lujinxingiaceae bacterium]
MAYGGEQRDGEAMGLGEIFGLLPLRKRLGEVAMVLRGDPYTPSSRFGVSSLAILQPKLSIRTWLGLTRADKRIPLYNLFNHTQTPPEDGWSVRVTQVRDFRGKKRTYDSHNGTDFAIPVGTIVVAPAAGEVLRVCSEFHRGGLKVLIDHGSGVITTSNHLGRALVEAGQRVERAQPIALAGASGVDMVAGFPWTVPHVHFNVWLNGEPVDPFARAGEVALWRAGNDPLPDHGAGDEEAFEPAAWDAQAVAEAIASCFDPQLRAELGAVEDPAQRAADVLFHLNYFPTRFAKRPGLYLKLHERKGILDIPFRASDFVGVIHIE